MNQPHLSLGLIIYARCWHKILATCLCLFLGFQGMATTQATIGEAPLTLNARWSSTEANFTWSMAWGDVDNDGDLDLAVGNASPPTARENKLYLNNSGTLQEAAAWTSGDQDHTTSVAWGDVDGDGDLDLAVGNRDASNKLYLNLGDGLLQTDADNPWASADEDDTHSVAWGDVDSDGDLDLAVGNRSYNKLYLNDNGTLQITAAWTATRAVNTRSVAWGDIDNDGDLDLAVGNANNPNSVYATVNGMLQTTPLWVSSNSANTTEIAWGDMNGDGYLDLAVSNSGIPNHVHLNTTTGTLTQIPAWSSDDQDQTWSVAWGDVDGDGDLDLAVGNMAVTHLSEPSKVYLNLGGTLQTQADNPWMVNDSDTTRQVAWGDVDGDGDLDLAAGNDGQPNKLYLNEGQGLQTQEDGPWVSADEDQTMSVAWGDVDGDGDLDLAVGNSNSANKLYRNEAGTLLQTPVWTSGSDDNTTSVAWGDVDGDGDLDLAVGNYEGANKVYLNEGGSLQTDGDDPWASEEEDQTSSVAWGDIDDDGDLDLAVGNSDSENKLYRNQAGALLQIPIWSSGDSDNTRSVAWGDIDNDGDLDLAVGNFRAANKVYLNLGAGVLQTEADALWFSNDADKTTSIAWGDVDGDGDLDLAVGNQGGHNKLYLNQNGVLHRTHGWESRDGENTLSVAWGDIDGDGDLDLAAGNENDDNKVYFNQNGILQTDAETIWRSNDINETRSIAWGDVDGDGDLDLAAGNRHEHDDHLFLRKNKVYLNQGRQRNTTLNEPAYATIGRPDGTDDAFFFSTPQILSATALSLTYTLFDLESNVVGRIYPEYSPNGGGQWFPATPGLGGDGVINLVASPSGTPHTFIWQAEADLIKRDNVLFRIQVQESNLYSPILWPAQASHSPPFRLEAPTFIRVVEVSGKPVVGAPVYANGQPIEQTLTGDIVTNQAGLLNPGPLTPGTSLVALAIQDEQPSTRDEHQGWAYRTYLTNLAIDALGNTTPFTVDQAQGEQRLVVQPDQALILFNLLVSIEWDADDAYLQDMQAAMAAAADFLYDVSDGQMTLGQVAIYDAAVHWTEADIQISAKNVVQPHAFVGGIFETDQAHLIRVGRFWDGSTASEGDWSAATGYRTLVHEFGHYALGLYDEYFGYEMINGELAGRKEAYCLSPDNRETANEATNVSIMDYHYTSSELADTHNWDAPTSWCPETAQHLLNEGESDWATINRLYGDAQGRWHLVSPDEKAGPGQVVSGPDRLPDTLPFPIVTYTNANVANDPQPFSVQVCADGEPYLEGVWITLVKDDGQTMDEGVTDETDGLLTILGAEPDDSLQAVSLDGVLAASKSVAQAQADGFIDLRLVSLIGKTGLADQPYLRLWPTTSGSALDGLRLALLRTSPTDSLTYIVTGHDGLGKAAPIPYNSETGQHQVQVSFIPVAQAGHARVLGHHASQFIELNVDYRLQTAINDRQNDLFANDGNLKLHLDVNGLSQDTVHFLITSPWGLPGPLPPGLTIVGEAYEITAADNIMTLSKPGVLRFRYDSTVSDNVAVTSLTIYRWSFGTNTWQALPSRHNEEAHEVSTPIEDLGLYALFGDSSRQAFSSRFNNACDGEVIDHHFHYLPLIAH